MEVHVHFHAEYVGMILVFSIGKYPKVILVISQQKSTKTWLPVIVFFLALLPQYAHVQ